MLLALVNSHRPLEIDVTSVPARIDGVPFPFDLVRLSPDKFHVIRDGKGYSAEIMELNPQRKTVIIRVNGTVHAVYLKDKFDLLLEKLGMNNGAGGKLNNIRAPMPGLIIDLRVADGQVIKAGDPLLILEAMKMENIIKSPGDGVVKQVKARKGDSVEKGQVLIEF